MEIKTRIKYLPHNAQEPFHNDRYKVLYRGVFGGTGSGKTVAGIFEDISWCIQNPGIVGYVFEPTYPMVKRILIPTLHQLLGKPLESSPLIQTFNRGDMRLDFTEGSTLWMGSLDNPERAEGPNIDFIHVDEARLIRNFQTAWLVIQRRLRGSGGGHPIGAWVTTTPDNPGSSLHKFFEGRDRDPDSVVYRMSLMDNIHLDEKYVNAVKRAHTGGLYKRFIEGVFADVMGGGFEFDYAVHVQNYVKPDIRRIIGGVDFGWTNESAVLIIALDGDNRMFVVDELYEARLSEEQLIQRIQTMQEKWGEGPLWCDSSEPRTIQKMRRAGLKARPNKSKRDDGIRELGGRFKDAGDGKRRLYINPECVNLIEELQLYDPDRKERDHAVDALRYACMGVARKRKEIQVLSGYRRT